MSDRSALIGMAFRVRGLAASACNNAVYRLRHPERIAAKSVLYRLRHPERVAALQAAKGAAYAAAYRRRHPEKVAAYAASLKGDALNAYGGPVCACCGEKGLVFLCIDHINGGGTKHIREIRKGGSSFYSWLKKHHYPPGYQILCHNCNWAKGAGDHCPHQDALR